ncbi:MAG: integrase arm-type DNA-binding domain-containing protein [Methyloceanibacter sp.]|nr:integrase arm-type DNA-binding domain-containing protein [Methyloceanibacter sp.]
MPKRALTDAAVKRIEPPISGQIDIFDQGFPGLALRVSYGGRKAWTYFYRIGKRLRRMTLGTYPALSLADARQAWREARTESQSGRDPSRVGKREKAPTDFKNVAGQWILRDQAKNRSRRIVARLIDVNVLPAWEHRAIGDIGRRDVLDVIDAIVDRGAVVTARRVQAHLHRLFVWSVGRGIIETNPLANLPKPGSETKRDRVLSDEELAAVWNAAGEISWQFGNAIRLLILTGARREEIGQLRWLEVKAADIELNGARTKNGAPHVIPLSMPARAIIEAMPRVAGSPFVLTIDGNKPISGWPRTKARLDDLLGIAPWRIHDLRRTTATGLQRLKTPLQVTEAILGHTAGSRAGVVGIYQRHDYADEKRAALEAWGTHVIALTRS